MRRLSWLALLAAVLTAAANARSKLTAQIDTECRDIEQQFQNQTPLVFSGPDPWEELDEIPSDMPDLAVAYVYGHGDDIRWVYLRIVDEREGWAEDISYYFRANGTLEKRIRTLQSAAANVLLEETDYYAKARQLKQKTHKRSLFPGHRDMWNFSDPNAPVFWTVEDLPFPLDISVWRLLS